MAKSTAAGLRRAALGEITNCPGVNTKVTSTQRPHNMYITHLPEAAPYSQKYVDTMSVSSPQRPGRGKASSKPLCAQKSKPAVVQVVPPAVQVRAAADPLPPVSEESADVSMKEEEELCQAFSEALLTVQDVDADDADLPQLCSQYVKDIYSYLHVLEVAHCLRSVCRSASSRVVFIAVCLRRCSRPYEQTTCRVTRSPSACELC